jgi:amino acid adenylation domain-containing protein
VRLDDLLRRAARDTPGATAASGPDGSLAFAELDRASDRVAAALSARAVKAGDRVGIWLPKSVRALAAMQGALRVGAAYVPCDAASPPSRVAKILEDCAVSALISSTSAAASVGRSHLLVGGSGADPGFDELPDSPPLAPVQGSNDALAYVLYTSGSTGTPKGVCISHGAALAFVEWAARTLETTLDDRFANHAPFHFDLSVLDIYAAWWGGARVVILPEGMAYRPLELVETVRRERISVWYSVPSALALMIDRGQLLLSPPAALRAILFAGEPFPIEYVRQLRARMPAVRLMNLYGPTETNVCTAFEVHTVADDRIAPVPIGKAVAGDRVWAVRADGSEIGPGEIGALLVAGPTVMNGYFGRPPLAGRPHHTGDLVRLLPDGNYEYAGRADQMVKVRGHRVELGEIESMLLQHVAIREAAVVFARDRLVAFVSSEGTPPSILAAKRHLAERLPRYMIIDELRVLDALPRTRNGKIDRASLAEAAATNQQMEVNEDGRK